MKRGRVVWVLERRAVSWEPWTHFNTYDARIDARIGVRAAHGIYPYSDFRIVPYTPRPARRKG